MIASDCVSTVAVVGDQRRHQPLRIEREIVVGALRAAAQVDERALGRRGP